MAVIEDNLKTLEMNIKAVDKAIADINKHTSGKTSFEVSLGLKHGENRVKVQTRTYLFVPPLSLHVKVFIELHYQGLTLCFFVLTEPVRDL